MSQHFYFPIATIAIDTNCCQAFTSAIKQENPIVGSVVLNHADFLSHVTHAIKAHKWDKSGQAKLKLPKTVFEHVSPGDGEHTHQLGDYVLSKHRGQVDRYLKRELAGRTASCSVVVYTREAYLSDPEVTVSLREGVEHVIVAVLASCCEESPYPWRTLVNNISGGNAEFHLSNVDFDAHANSPLDHLADADKAYKWQDLAKISIDHWTKHCLVAG